VQKARVRRCHPGGNPGANRESISHRCYLFEIAFVWELTKETIHLPLGCLQGGTRRLQAVEATSPVSIGETIPTPTAPRLPMPKAPRLNDGRLPKTADPRSGAARLWSIHALARLRVAPQEWTGFTKQGDVSVCGMAMRRAAREGSAMMTRPRRDARARPGLRLNIFLPTRNRGVSGPREATGNAFEPELDLFLLFVLEIGHVTPDIRGRLSVGSDWSNLCKLQCN